MRLMWARRPAIVTLARRLHLDPEEALRQANRKSASRFQYVERAVAGEGRTIRDVPLDEMLALWDSGKTADEA